MFRYLILLLMGVLLVSTCGCAVMDTGPRVVEQGLATGKVIAMEVIKDLRAQAGQAGVAVDVNDPEYYMEFMTGPVYLVRVKIGIHRASMTAQLQANLVEDLEVTEADIAIARDILNRPDLDRERRDALLMELTERGYEFWEKALGLGSDDRTTIQTDGE